MTISAELFQPHVGTAFSVTTVPGQAPDLPFTLRLDEVAISRFARPGQKAFSLLFEGDASFTLQQGTYFLQHDTLAEQPMFLVPIARTAEGFRYQACFNLA
ncbi:MULTISPECIES: DUF6916 family protein [Ralstonia]|uniref:DUF6916 domain-containing protein n=1 Tax=Ralstonia wenshanensis TaxID=2842456 RepID=A0AAD2B2P1_9RALS|nr:hypothetical protein [Ralstonia wenshanensis]MCT7308299.1 hypothetical protein [Ralstonia wenshanensis]CAJ0699777.1 hypothetical protein LMG18091_03018 [Ralstonia wenshanensis]CAJ0818131.1 hypothetical protein LMG19087_03329 [Ralstonia wenshanensis]